MTFPTHGTAPNVMVSITRQTTPRHDAQFERFLEGITAIMAHSSGDPGISMFCSIPPGDQEYQVIFQFDHLSQVRCWEASPDRQGWQVFRDERGLEEPHMQVLIGSDGWFTVPSPPGELLPPRYKMVLLTWLAVFPLLTVLSLLFGPVLMLLPLVLRLLVLTAVTVPLLAYLVLPGMMRVFARWLYPPSSRSETWHARGNHSRPAESTPEARESSPHVSSP